MSNGISVTVAGLLLSTLVVSAVSADTAPKEPESLDLKAKDVKRQVVNASQIGYTSTRIFYTLNDQRVVVVIHVDNKKEGFPVSGKVCRFAKTVTAEGIAKWLNNQHSDGLFPEVPEPEATDKIPAEAFQTVASKLVGPQKTPFGSTFNQHTVEFKLKATKVGDRFVMKESGDTVSVYVEVK